jgi:hypothetical protein
VAPYSDVASFSDGQLDCCDLLRRRVIHYGKRENTNACKGVSFERLGAPRSGGNLMKICAALPTPESGPKGSHVDFDAVEGIVVR